MAPISPGPFLQLFAPCDGHWREVFTLHHLLRIVPDFAPTWLQFPAPRAQQPRVGQRQPAPRGQRLRPSGQAQNPAGTLNALGGLVATTAVDLHATHRIGASISVLAPGSRTFFLAPVQTQHLIGEQGAVGGTKAAFIYEKSVGAALLPA